MNVYEKIYLIGNGRVAHECLRILHEHRKDIAFLNIEREQFGSSKKFCERNGISCIEIQKSKVKDFFMELASKTLIISAHNSYLFPREVVEKDNLKIINMHIALLPKYRGMNAPTWEIYEQQEYAGTTWHIVSEKVDAGEIILQERFKIGAHDTAVTVLRKSFDLGVQMLKENAEAFLSGRYKTSIPSEKTRLYLHREKPNDGYMEKDWDIEKKYAFLRSMDYSGTNIMPLPKIKLNETIYEIWKYNLSETDEEDKEMIIEKEDNKVEWVEEGKRLICCLREAYE